MLNIDGDISPDSSILVDMLMSWPFGSIIDGLVPICGYLLLHHIKKYHNDEAISSIALLCRRASSNSLISDGDANNG